MGDPLRRLPRPLQRTGQHDLDGLAGQPPPRGVGLRQSGLAEPDSGRAAAKPALQLIVNPVPHQKDRRRHEARRGAA